MIKTAQDLLQGLIEYPVPVYSQSTPELKRDSTGKFFQIIPPPKARQRLSRRNLAGPSERDRYWEKLRKAKNI